MIRFLISTISFLTILGLYYAYALYIVPVILPELPEREPAPMSESREELKPYQGIFMTGSWERDSKEGIQLIQVGRTIILFKDDEISGSIAKLRPCTLLFLPEEPESKTQKLEEQLRQAIILRTAEHAEIEFDSELNLSRTPFPKMKGGRLYGQVTISSEMKEVGPHDDLYIETENVSFSETPALTTVSTAKDVRFRWGFNQGEGSILRLEIAQVNPKDAKSPKILNHVQFETLRGLQLFFPDDFETAKKSVAPPPVQSLAGGPPAVQSPPPGSVVASTAEKTGSQTKPQDPKPQDSANNKPVSVPALADATPLLPIAKIGQMQADFPSNLPDAVFTVAVDIPRRIVLPSVPATTIDVSCQREFLFKADKEPDSWTAAFRGDVNAVRTNADKAQDVITCEELLLNFQSKVKAPAAKTPAAKTPLAKTQGPDNKSVPKESPLSGQFSDLEPVRFLALGKLARPGQAAIPARLTSPQGGGVVMEGDRILYDLRANMLALETEKATGASTEVRMFLQNRYVIQGDKGFQYTMGQEGAFGTLKSFGKGSLRGKLGDEKNLKNLNLFWGAMQMLPAQDPNEILIELTQGVSVEMEEFGKMTSGTLQIWCTLNEQTKTAQTPAAPPKTAVKPTPPTGAAGLQALSGGGKDGPFAAQGNFIPQRAVALEKVHFENSSGTVDVARLDVFFRQVGAEQKTAQSRWVPHVMTQEKPRPNDFVRRYLPTQFWTEQEAGGFATVLSPPMRVSSQSGSAMSLASAPRDGRSPLQNYVPNNLPKNSPVRQVQHLEPVVASGPGKMPNAPAAPTAPVALGTAPRPATPPPSNVIPNRTPASVPPGASPDTTTVNSQNLLGIQSGPSSLGYAITGDQMKMNVDQDGGRSYVEQIWIGGNVRIAEKVPPTFQGEFVDITGDVIHVWNPSFPDTTIWIYGKQGREAVFKGKGVQMNAMKMEIYRLENEIHVKGPGRLVAVANADTKSLLGGVSAGGTPAVQSVSSLQPPASGLQPPDPLLVQWNEGMFCNGKTVAFIGTADLNGERVKALYQHQKVVCDLLVIHLSRFVSFFDDKSKEPIEAELIECAKDVFVENKTFDEQNQLKSYDRARFDAMQIQVKTGIFVANGSPGVLQRTFLNDGSGFAEKQQELLPGGSVKLAAAEGELAYLGVWFYEDIQGNFLGNRQVANIRGRVKVVYCPVVGWADEIEIYRLNMAVRRGYRMDCERLEIAQFPDPMKPNASTVELSAYENAKIEGESDNFYGRAQAIKFNQSKNLIIFDGNAFIKQDQMEMPAQRIEYNIKTKAISTSHAQGVMAGR